MKKWTLLAILGGCFALTVRVMAVEKCLKPIEGWQVLGTSAQFAHSAQFTSGWKALAVKVTSSDPDDETNQIVVTHGGGKWIMGCYPGQPFLVGHFAGTPDGLAVMYVQNVRNGLGTVDWKLFLLTTNVHDVTVTASADILDGGRDSVFQGYGHALGYLKTEWGRHPENRTDGTWFSGQVCWFDGSKFERDTEHFPVKFVRLTNKVMGERGKSFENGVIGKPSKLLGIGRWWCS